MSTPKACHTFVFQHDIICCWCVSSQVVSNRHLQQVISLSPDQGNRCGWGQYQTVACEPLFLEESCVISNLRQASADWSQCHVRAFVLCLVTGSSLPHHFWRKKHWNVHQYLLKLQQCTMTQNTMTQNEINTKPRMEGYNWTNVTTALFSRAWEWR